MPRPVIDVEFNRVVGQTNANMSNHGHWFEANFWSGPEGLVVAVTAKSLIRGSIEYGLPHRLAARLTDAIEAALKAREGGPNIPPPAPEVLPIARATGEVAKVRATSPIYEAAPPMKRGDEILQYAVVGLLCCSFLGSVTVYRGWRALQEYGPRNPGDKHQIYIGIVLGIVTTAILLFFADQIIAQLL